MRKIYDFIFGIPKTLIFNFKYMGLKNGIKIPVFVSRNVKITKLKGKVVINKPIKTGMIKLGFGDVGIFDKNKEKSIWSVAGKVIFSGKANLGHGFRISVSESGQITFGDKFIISSSTSIICHDNISFGDNCLISWQCQIMDNDFHSIYCNEIKRKKKSPITIGNNVWICSRVSILKGVIIGNNSVIGCGSVVTNKFYKNNILILGIPAKEVKSGIKWSID